MSAESKIRQLKSMLTNVNNNIKKLNKSTSTPKRFRVVGDSITIMGDFQNKLKNKFSAEVVADSFSGSQAGMGLTACADEYWAYVTGENGFKNSNDITASGWAANAGITRETGIVREDLCVWNKVTRVSSGGDDIVFANDGYIPSGTWTGVSLQFEVIATDSTKLDIYLARYISGSLESGSEKKISLTNLVMGRKYKVIAFFDKSLFLNKTKDALWQSGDMVKMKVFPGGRTANNSVTYFRNFNISFKSPNGIENYTQTTSSAVVGSAAALTKLEMVENQFDATIVLFGRNEASKNVASSTFPYIGTRSYFKALDKLISQCKKNSGQVIPMNCPPKQASLSGNVTFANNSKTVTGTNFTNDIKGLYIKLSTDDVPYVQIDSIQSSTQLTLVSNYTGSNASGTAMINSWDNTDPYLVNGLNDAFNALRDKHNAGVNVYENFINSKKLPSVLMYTDGLHESNPAGGDEIISYLSNEVGSNKAISNSAHPEITENVKHYFGGANTGSGWTLKTEDTSSSDIITNSASYNSYSITSLGILRDVAWVNNTPGESIRFSGVNGKQVHIIFRIGDGLGRFFVKLNAGTAKEVNYGVNSNYVGMSNQIRGYYIFDNIPTGDNTVDIVVGALPLTGTATFTTGSSNTIVTGYNNSTKFMSEVSVGSYIKLLSDTDDAVYAQVASIQSDTQLTLTSGYTGTLSSTGTIVRKADVHICGITVC